MRTEFDEKSGVNTSSDESMVPEIPRSLSEMFMYDEAHAIPDVVFTDHPDVGKTDILRTARTRRSVVNFINEWGSKLEDGEEPTDDCFLLPDFLVGAVGDDYPPLQEGWYRIDRGFFAALFSLNEEK